MLQLTSAALHILAMGFMLCDHLWAVLLPDQEWLTCLGRLAFPMFAFLVAEGCRHTHDRKRYLRRMLAWAVVTELPFNLMYGGSLFYPFHQNVLWTFLLSMLLITLTEKYHFSPAWIVLPGFLLGYATMADYYGVGVLTVLVFYFFGERTWKHRLIQLVCLYILNVSLLGGLCYELTLFGHIWEVPQQGFALLALAPIWLYQGQQGFHSKPFQVFCYAFYPAHMLVLVLIQKWLTR